MTELTWTASSPASALYAAAALCRGQTLVDGRLAQALSRPAGTLSALVARLSISPKAFFDHAVPLAAGIENRRELAGLILRRATGQRPTEELVTELAAAITAVEKAAGDQLPSAVPSAATEIELRSRPLREQWESRGPGLLLAICRATDPALQIARANVLPVQPVTGGGGVAYLPDGTVSIEAMLTNPQAQLPEVVRLGWLVSTLQMAQPQFSEAITPARLPWLAGMSMLPAALEAAEYVELARNDRPSWQLALETWRLVPPDQAGQRAQLVETLETWWRTFRQSPTSWAVALTALDRMLPTDDPQSPLNA